MTDKDKRAKRFQQKNRHIDKQNDIWNQKDYRSKMEQPHRFHKKKALDCGQPQCVCCGNPRRIFGEKTIQERRFECQAEVDTKKDPICKYEWEDLNDPEMEWDG